MSRDMQEPVKWDRDAIDSLLRFGRKNDGPWNDSAGIDKDGRELYMPDDGDTDLVAAAPDLYEALEEALIDWDDSQFYQDYPYKIEWADKARAALAKARGKYE